MYEDMSMEELEKLLTRKERLFVEEYDRDGNGTQAAIRAGYSPGKKNASASVQASKLLRSAKISAYRRARANELCSQMGISRETIRLNVMDIYYYRNRSGQTRRVQAVCRCGRGGIP